MSTSAAKHLNRTQRSLLHATNASLSKYNSAGTKHETASNGSTVDDESVLHIARHHAAVRCAYVLCLDHFHIAKDALLSAKVHHLLRFFHASYE